VGSALKKPANEQVKERAHAQSVEIQPTARWLTNLGERTRKCSLRTLRPTNAAIHAASSDGLTRSGRTTPCHLVGPDIVARETDVLPAEGRHVRDETWLRAEGGQVPAMRPCRRT
jgi:hypothetical protein